MSSQQPGSQLAVSSGSGGLMLPPPPRPPKRKEVVLDEDEYTATLEAIIERDFFPELAKLESKVAWLQAVRSGDPEQIRHAQLLIAQRRAAAGTRPFTGATPAGGPLFTPGGTAARAIAGHTPYLPGGLPPGIPLRQPRPDTGATAVGEDEDGGEAGVGVVVPPPVSLDTFLAAHTSEDNASFQELLEETNKRRRLRAAARLAPPPDPKLLITDGREKTDGYGTTGQQPDTLISWRHEPRNALYYDSSTREVVPYTEAELAAMVQGPPKAINHSATRFPKELQASASATPSASTAGGAAGSVVSGGGSGAPPAAAVGGGTRGYDILATPSFDPGVEQTPFMTWGDIEGTPLRIEAEDLPPGPMTQGPSFVIREDSRKEKVAHQLAVKAGASLRSKHGARGGTPLVTSALAAATAARRQGTGAAAARPPTGAATARGKPLSAAARRLASSLHRGRLADTDFGLRASYRPGSSRRPATGSRPASSGAGSSWSANPTPSRGWTPAGTPSVHATLEAEEARVQALMKQRRLDEQQRRQQEEAREAAKRAFQQQQQRVSTRRPAHAAAGAAGAGADAGGDLTAGLLNI